MQQLLNTKFLLDSISIGLRIVLLLYCNFTDVFNENIEMLLYNEREFCHFGHLVLDHALQLAVACQSAIIVECARYKNAFRG